ncbi:cathepsin L1 [Pelomyxa schiedti]|nr:cathepsin L1 [Pelomyxa schiedti]
MQKLLVALLFVAVVSCSSIRSQFDEWTHQYGRTYATRQERLHRYNVWRSNLQLVTDHNSNSKNTWTLGMNQFADLTVDEYRAMLSAPRTHAAVEAVNSVQAVTPVDWRDQGKVCPIKNQGSCGSCWAFSAIASIESCYAIDNNVDPICLSEQQLVDCAGIKYGDLGCGGGLPDNAFRFVMDNGCETEEEYPYTAKRGTCVEDASKYVVHIGGLTDIPSGDEAALQEAVVKAPVSVAIDASLASFQLYKDGIYCPDKCSNVTLDHGVDVVGQNTDNKEDYYIVKNSWGTSWGIQGYIWMCANKNNNCGIATEASYPTKCSGK